MPARNFIPQAVRSFLRRLLYRNSLTTSQAGQDYWIYGEVFDEKRGGYFLDIGAHDGISLSNTYILESRYNWTGICIEANPITFEALKTNRRARCLNVCLDRSEGEVNFILGGVMGGILDQDVDNKESDPESGKVVRLKTVPLVKILEDHHAPGIIDYLSIDVEGAEERVLAEFDFHKYTFRSISIERPTELLRALLKDHDYILIKEIPRLDCFYVHKDFMEEYRNNLFQFYRKMHLTLRWR
jgi:FkbM family methyltransferase